MLQIAMEYLHSLDHTQIGFIGFAGSAKYDSYWLMQSRLGLSYDPHHLELLNPIDFSPGLLAGFHAMRRVIARKDDMPTAMSVTNDYVSYGAMEALHTADVSVPVLQGLV